MIARGPAFRPISGYLRRANAAANKIHKDMLDAVICAWIAICALQGRAEQLGDADAAIWIPVGKFWPRSATTV